MTPIRACIGWNPGNTTQENTTGQEDTQNFETTVPLTEEASTQAPTTEEPATEALTEVPTTEEPTTEEPTADQTTEEPTEAIEVPEGMKIFQYEAVMLFVPEDFVIELDLSAGKFLSTVNYPDPADSMLFSKGYGFIENTHEEVLKSALKYDLEQRYGLPLSDYSFTKYEIENGNVALVTLCVEEGAVRVIQKSAIVFYGYGKTVTVSFVYASDKYVDAFETGIESIRIVK